MAADAGRETAVIIALGSRLRGDDAAGPCVADTLKRTVGNCRLIEECDDPMAILNAWDGATTAVVIDAAVSGAPPGTVRRFELDAAPLGKDISRCSSHGLGLAEAVQLGRVMQRMPRALIVYAIEGQSFEPGEALSPAVTAATAKVAREIERDLLQRCAGHGN